MSGIDTKGMRSYAEGVWMAHVSPTAKLIHAAADEIDRLRAEVKSFTEALDRAGLEDSSEIAQVVNEVRRLRAENEQLRAENVRQREQVIARYRTENEWLRAEVGKPLVDRLLAALNEYADSDYQHVPEGHARIDGQVVRVEHARNHKYDYEGAYIAGTFCGWVDDEADAYGRCADGFYQPLYVAVPLDSEEADDE